MDGEHQDIGWDNCDDFEGNGIGGLLNAGKEVKGKTDAEGDKDHGEELGKLRQLG